MAITVADLLEAHALSLHVVAGSAGLERPLSTSKLNRPSLELTGYFDSYRPERVQVFGAGEIHYITQHDTDPEVRAHLQRIVADPVPCVIISNADEASPYLSQLAEERAIPLLTCPFHTSKLYKRLWEHLDEEFAPETWLHAVLMDVHDEGVLLLGDSSIGKSECAMELIRRGFRLVADDSVRIKCLGGSQLMGYYTDILPYHMEVRGLGVIDVRSLFGISSVRSRKRINLAISLEEWNPSREYDRTGLEESTLSILDVDVPHVTIPVRPGRNVGTLVEVATLERVLRSQGINTTELMEETLRRKMNET